MQPINAINNNPARIKRKVKVRPLPESGVREMGRWIVNHSWDEVYNASTVHEKAECLQSILLEKLNHFLPEKVLKFSSDDQVWVTPEIKEISRKKSREYFKHRKSARWKVLNDLLAEKCEMAKKAYYTNIVNDLKESNPAQWYSKLKRMTSYDDQKSEEIIVAPIAHLSNSEQAEIIAENFSKISNSYEPINPEKIPLVSENNKMMPKLEAFQVCKFLEKMKTNTSTVKDNIPAKILKEFAPELSEPMAHILNSMVESGIYPNCWKLEIVTPVAKKYPPSDLDDLRKISGLKNLSKIAEKMLGQFLITDMAATRDLSQYGNQKKMGVNHYLINMIHEILVSVDSNAKSEKFAVFCSFIDWKQAFDRQCPTLGVNSFVKNCVRNSLIPLLINYFQDRKMVVKWHGALSKLRKINGGGPQGSLWGILEYLSQSNDNTNFIETMKKFKFIDDLSILELINLLSIGLSSCNWKSSVASDIPENGFIIPSENMKSQLYLDKLSEWTKQNKMKLNAKKTCAMIFNFTKDFQFTSRVNIEGEPMAIISETKVLGVVINNKLTWESNTKSLVQKANSRMRLLHKLVEFGVSIKDLLNIYILYIRSILEQSCQVWHSSLTLENFLDLERVQKNALKVILQDNYISYNHALSISGIQTLFERREALCLRFAKSCVKNNLTKHMFPENNSRKAYDVKTRFPEKYKVMTNC